MEEVYEDDPAILLSWLSRILKTDGFEKRHNLEPMLLGSVTDPLHFGMDPDLRIRTSDLWILLVSSLTFKMATRNYLLLCLLLL